MPKKPANEVSADVAAQFSVASVGEDAPAGSDVLAQLLGQGPELETDEGVELDMGEMGALQEEFDTIEALVKQKEQLEDKLKEVNAALTAQKFRMVDAMTLQGTRQFGSATGNGACSISERYDTTVDDPDAFMEWVKERHPDLLTVNSQTRNSFIRKNFKDQGVAEDDESFPPGITVTPREQLTVRGVKTPKGKKSDDKK